MLTLDFFTHLAMLDLQWFVELAMDNILWVFIMLAIVFVYNKKFSWTFFIVVVISIFSNVEIFAQFGIILLSAGFLFVYYVCEIIVLNFTDTIPSLKDRIPLVLTVYFLAMVSLYMMGVF